MKQKIRLTKLEVENWRFVLYESSDNQLYASFPYTPNGYVDLEVFIKLTKNEEKQTRLDRNFLFKISDDVRDHYPEYFSRHLRFEDFEIEN